MAVHRTSRPTHSQNYRGHTGLTRRNHRSKINHETPEDLKPIPLPNGFPEEVGWQDDSKLKQEEIAMEESKVQARNESSGNPKSENKQTENDILRSLGLLTEEEDGEGARSDNNPDADEMEIGEEYEDVDDEATLDDEYAEDEGDVSSLTRSEKIEMLRELVRRKVSRKRICEIMNITVYMFNELFFVMSNEDNRYGVPYKQGGRIVFITEKGFAVSKERLENLGLEKAFKVGNVLEFKTKYPYLILSSREATEKEKTKRKEMLQKRAETSSKRCPDEIAGGSASAKISQMETERTSEGE